MSFPAVCHCHFLTCWHTFQLSIQFRAEWGTCPGNRIILAKALEALSWLTIISCFFSMSETNRKIWINSSSGFVCLSSRVIWSLWNHLMLPEMHIPKPTLSNMSLTCQGRPEELYLLQHEVQPLNSCWQSCSSANHPLTYNTGISNI